MAQSHEPPTFESMRGAAAVAGVALVSGRKWLSMRVSSYKLPTVIVGTIYDAFGAVTIDRALTLPVRAAKPWRVGHERRRRRREGWRTSMEARIDGNVNCGSVSSTS